MGTPMPDTQKGGTKKDITNVSMSSSDTSCQFDTSTPNSTKTSNMIKNRLDRNHEYMKTSDVLDIFKTILDKLNKLDVLDSLIERVDVLKTQTKTDKENNTDIQKSIEFNQENI